MATTGQVEDSEIEEQKNIRNGKLIPLLPKNDTDPSHPNKKGLRKCTVAL
jgi:hypothetical protein